VIVVALAAETPSNGIDRRERRLKRERATAGLGKKLLDRFFKVPLVCAAALAYAPPSRVLDSLS
jgi:hypothetical protein